MTKAAFLGIAWLALAGVALTSPASALPVSGAVAGGPEIETAAMVSRTVRQGPRCRTVVTRKRGPGGVKVVKRKTCL